MSAAAHMTPHDDQPPLAGVITLQAKAVLRAIEHPAFSHQQARFLTHLATLTFGDAGLHRQFKRERPGTWCLFDLLAWCDEHPRGLGMSKAQVCHLRAHLVELGIITYDVPSQAIGWVLDLSKWRPLQPDYARHGGARKGAGCKHNGPGCTHRKLAGIDNLNADQAGIDNLNATTQSSCQQTPIKLSTTDASQGRQEAAGGEVVRMDTINQKETTPPPPTHERAREAEQVAATAAASAATARPLTRLDKQHPDDRAAAWGVIDTLRDIPDWRPDDRRDSDLLLKLMQRDLPMTFVAWRADTYALHDVKHDASGFFTWCTNDVARSIYERWLADREAARVSQSTPAPEQGRANQRRQGVTSDGLGRRTDRPTYTPSRRAPGRGAGAGRRTTTRAPQPGGYDYL